MNPPPNSPRQPNPGLPPASPDPALSSLLRSWDVPAEAPPGFENRVWARIHARRKTSPSPSPVDFWSGLLDWFEAALQLPFAKPAFLAALLLAGLAGGAVHGHASSSELTAQLQDRYIQSIDPFAARPR